MTGDFSCKWMHVLTSIVDRSEYLEHANIFGWDDLSTRELPNESQLDINRLKSPITKGSVLVLNHAYSFGFENEGFMVLRPRPYEVTYFENLRKLLDYKDPSKVDAVFFDFPEFYVLDSRKRLELRQIQSVVLTAFDGGGSLYKGAALQEIGSGKTIYLAGSYTPCLGRTANELWENDNNIKVILDACLSGDNILDLDSNLKIEEFKEEFDLEGLEFITTNQFLEQFARAI